MDCKRNDKTMKNKILKRVRNDKVLKTQTCHAELVSASK